MLTEYFDIANQVQGLSGEAEFLFRTAEDGRQDGYGYY